MRVISLWSGGKDSCFACYQAKLQGYEIVTLINFANPNGTSSISHGLSAQIIQKQARLIDIPFFQKAMPKEGYPEAFKALINDWKSKKGIAGIVFGDIYLQEHKDWIDKVCAELQVEPIMPLWGKDTTDLINEIIRSGFKAILVSLKTDVLSQDWLGREINHKFINDLKAIGGIDLCGEKGEFHTFVYAGPLFKKPVKFITGKRFLKDNRWFLELI